MLADEDEAEIESKLGLFQAFSKLYEHDRKLLDDVLAADLHPQLPAAHYIQSVICHEQVYIISNLSAGQSESFYSLDGLWTIGRDPRQSDIAVPDKRLSRCHAAVQYNSAQEFILSDLESTNGTYVNGEKLQRVHTLQDGDRIRIGSSLFHFFHCKPKKEAEESSRTANSGASGARTLH